MENVLDWFIANGIEVTQELIDVARLARHINISLELQNTDAKTSEQAKNLIAL